MKLLTKEITEKATKQRDTSFQSIPASELWKELNA